MRTQEFVVDRLGRGQVGELPQFGLLHTKQQRADFA